MLTKYARLEKISKIRDAQHLQNRSKIRKKNQNDILKAFGVTSQKLDSPFLNFSLNSNFRHHTLKEKILLKDEKSYKTIKTTKFFSV